MRNRPDRTRSRNACNVAPSNGRAPQTRTYNTTPKLWSTERKRKFSVKFLPYQFKEEEWPIDAHCRKSARTVN